MFKYLWMVIQDLFITVTYAALMHTMLSRAAGQKGHTIHGIALVAGVLASAALAAVKFNTKLIISSHWNHYIYAFIMGFTLAFILFSLLSKKKWSRIPLCLTLSRR